MVTLQLYVEGGGNSPVLQAACRKGFRKFLEKAGLVSCRPQIFASGSRRIAYDNFCRAHAESAPGEFVALLVDSEGPVTQKSAWRHLKNRPEDGWSQPHKATEEQCHLMVQCMESWFLADPEKLAAFYGQGFRPNVLPSGRPIEEVPKDDVFAAINRAVKSCKTKKAYDKTYDKGKHSFDLLSRLDPVKVMAKSPWAKRLVDVLKKELAAEENTS